MTVLLFRKPTERGTMVKANKTQIRRELANVRRLSRSVAYNMKGTVEPRSLNAKDAQIMADRLDAATANLYQLIAEWNRS